MRKTAKLLARARSRSRRARRLVRRTTRHGAERLPRALFHTAHAGFRPLYGRSLRFLGSRDEIPALLNRRGLVGTAVEIGVKRGRYSERLLRSWQGERLISVDPWAEALATDYVDTANVAQEQHERFYRETVERLSPFGQRSEIWRMTSAEAAARVADASVDFVYVDARHDYASALEDVRLWLPKVRPGGILAGHDYADGSFPQGEFGVKRAVDEVARDERLAVHTTLGRWPLESFPSWLLEIPARP